MHFRFYPAAKSDLSGKNLLISFRFVCGVFIFIASIFLLFNIIRAQNSVAITAYITKIEDKKVSIGYEYEEKFYERPTGFYNSKLSLGDKLNISVDKRHPGQFFLKGENDLYIFGIVLFSILIILSFLPKFIKKRRKNL